ncbi:HlyD family efflux transporter periplasmic adaptor subunit, partial [Flavihumibacter sp. CACIAM 22H1]|uniref:efflux RND transporter periplasmic adaptor subunit n=1 Tax=Flavihumibacter sp. CACIAM 22H1 TaxID=1812911 RepID=UPI0007A8CC40
QGIGTRNELEQRQLAMENSAANLEIARRQYNELERQIRFTAQQARKNLAISREQQNDFIIKSESDGRVYKLLKEKGETVNLQQPIATIGNPDAFILELLVDEYDIARISEGQKVIVQMDSYKGQVFEARLTKIDPIMDERTRSFLVEASFIQAPEKLYPNLSAEANIVVQSKPKTLTIPRTYLVQDSFVLLENKEKRKVKTGLKDYQLVEILEGITVHDHLLDPLK